MVSSPQPEETVVSVSSHRPQGNTIPPSSPPQEEVTIPVALEDDLDSAYGDAEISGASSTASVTASLREGRQIYNRKYQNYKELDYWGPNDETGKEHLDIMHHLLTLLLDNKLFLAPIAKDVQKVLDIGCGTGIWAIDFADQYPSAEVIGIDLSDIMPTFVPPNCRFEIDDAELDWTFKANTFEYIHLRYMMGSIGNWPRLYKQAFKAMKPGGYIEHFDLTPTFESDDGTLSEDSPLNRWGPLGIEASEKMGKTFKIYPTTREALVAAGFVDIVEHNFKIPVGPWSSDKRLRTIGQWNLFFLTMDIEGIWLYLLTQFLGWSQVEVMLWVGEVSRALRDSKTHVYYRANVFYGRKPEVQAPRSE